MAKIMIVDDEQSVREALAALLTAAGHEACMASDGSAALTRLSTFQADLIITDILMPGMEGMQTINELRHQRPDLPVIAMSGGAMFGGLDYLRTAERLGATGTLSKPVSPRALIEMVSRLLTGIGLRPLAVR